MKHITILLAFLMTLSTQANANNLRGEMVCKVKTNSLTTISDGIGSEYKQLKNRFVVGDELLFLYEFNNNKLSVKLRDGIRNLNYWDMTLDGGTGAAHNGQGMMTSTSDHWFTKDSIESRGSHIIEDENGNEDDWRYADGKVRLRRYYKNDWDGIIYYHPMNRALHVFTIDCRHTTDQLDQLLVALSNAQNKIED